MFFVVATVVTVVVPVTGRSRLGFIHRLKANNYRFEFRFRFFVLRKKLAALDLPVVGGGAQQLVLGLKRRAQLNEVVDLGAQGVKAIFVHGEISP